MVKQKFVCRQCGLRFEKEVFEEGEADDKNLRSSPVRCPRCSSVDIERF